MRTPRHETALRYAALGIPVFPCRPGGKEPASGHGFHDATTDTWIIERWWATADYNIGIVPENNQWCVVDLDRKNGVDGVLEWKTLEGEKPDTFTVATPSGGRHLYYRGSLASTVRKLAPGIDTRGRGGYVLLPPSIVDGKEYRVLPSIVDGQEYQGTFPPEDWDCAPLPAWVAAKLGHVERPRLEAPAGVELDLPINIERARSFLRGQWGAVEREGGDQHTYLMAQYALDAGLSVDGAFDAMQEWNARCYPPWSDDDLRTKIENAWKYRQNAPGAYALSEGTPANWREYVNTLPPEPKLDFPAPTTLREAQSVIYPPLEWIWNNRFIAGLPNLLTGDVKMGKTTLAKNLAVAVAAGIPLLGAETRQMPVVLLLGEDLAGPVRDDLMRIAQEMQAPDNALDRVSFLSVVSDHIPGGSWLATIEDKHGTVSETDFMRHLIEAGHIPRGCLFIIDPLAKFVLFNQHDPTSARALHDRFCEPLCRSLGITVLVNDHPSAASIERKDHAAGSKHFKAPFAAFATLLDKGKAGKTQHRLLDFREMRYAAGEAIDVYRGESPVFSLHPYGADDPKEVEMRVYEHVKERLDMGEHTGKDGHASYGPAEIGQALCIDEGQVKVAIDTCIRAEYLRWVARKGGGDGKIPAHLELGHVTPLARPMRY